MINPKSDEVVVALRALALADTLGHSVTTEEAHAQAKEILIELQTCRNCEMKRRAQFLVWCLMAKNAAAESGTELAVLQAATDSLRSILKLARKGFFDTEQAAA